MPSEYNTAIIEKEKSRRVYLRQEKYDLSKVVPNILFQLSGHLSNQISSYQVKIAHNFHTGRHC